MTTPYTHISDLAKEGLFRFKVRTSGFSGLSTGAGSDSFPVRLAW